MRKYITLIIAMVMLFSMVACSSRGQQTPNDSTTPSTENSTSLPLEPAQESVQSQKPFDPHDPDQPELIAVRNALSSTIKEHNFPFEVDMTTVGMGSPNDSEDSFSFNLEYNDIVKTQFLEITVCALNDKMQKGFEVYLNPDCEEAVLKDAVLCSILAIAPDLDITQAENFYLEMTDGYNWEGRSNVIEVNGYNLHISEGALLRSGSGGHRGYPMLHVVAQNDLLPQHTTSEYKSISSEMESRDLVYFTGAVNNAYEDGYSYIMEVSSDDAVCGIYYMEDKFAGCFETGQTYTFYGWYAGARDGFEYSIKLDGFEIEQGAPDTSNANGNREENNIDIPTFFTIVGEENLSEIPEKSALDRIIDDSLSIIGVEKIEYMAYGNYMPLANLGVQLDAFIITDVDRTLTANMIFMNRSKEWSITYISDAKNNKYYYVPSDAGATVDIYDYKTGELVSEQSMPHEEYNGDIEKQQKEADQKFQEELNRIADEYGLDTSDTTDITVRFETDHIDGDRLHVTVFTKNISEDVFTGNVYVTFYSADGKDRLGSDTIIVDELLPGRESWADIIVDAYGGTPKMTVDFSEVSFTPIKEITAEIDTDATEKTKSCYYWNFDGVSWYDDITDIVVYTDGSCIVTVKKETTENSQFYAATIWSCGNDHGVEEVQVVDPDGSILAVY